MNVNSKVHTQFKGTYDPFIKPLVNIRANQMGVQMSPPSRASKENDPVKKAKKWVVATVTGGTAFSILCAGLLISYLTGRRGTAMADLPIKLRRMLLLSIQNLEAQTQKSKFDLFMIKTQKYLKEGMDSALNGLTNFDHSSKTFFDEKLMGQGNKPENSLNILQKFAVKSKNFFMNVTEKAAVNNYEKVKRTFIEMEMSVEKLIDSFKAGDIVRELQKNGEFEDLIDSFKQNEKTIADLLVEIKNGKNKNIHDLLTEKAKSLDLDDLKKRIDKDPRLQGLSEALKDKKFCLEFQEEILLRFVVTKLRLGNAKTEVCGLISDFNVNRVPSVKKDLKLFVERYRQILKGVMPEEFSTEELSSKAKEAYSYLTKSYNAEMLWKEIHGKEVRSNLLNKKENVVRAIEDNCYRIKRLFNQVDNVFTDALYSKDINKETLKELKFRFRDLKSIVENYQYPSGNEKMQREELKTQFISKIDEIISFIKKPSTEDLKNYNPEAENIKLIVEKLENAKERLDVDNKGLIEKVRGSLQYYCSYEEGNETKTVNLMKALYKSEYKNVKSNINMFSDSLRKAVRFELDDYEGRMRELALGAGNFELIGPVFGALAYANEMRKSETKEERVSKSLTLGVPIAGGLVAWVYANLIKCVNGPSSILLSLGVGLLFNKVGGFIDDNFYSKGRKWSLAEGLKDIEGGSNVYRS